MKFIKGNYEKALRTHEEIKHLVRNEQKNTFYYLQDNGNFTYSLMIYNELAIPSLDEEELLGDYDWEALVNIKVATLGQNHNQDLKELVKNYIKENNINLKPVYKK